MEGFGPALFGHYDADDQLTRYLRARAEDCFAAAREQKAAIDSREEFEASREHVRDEFLDRIGGLPERPDGRRTDDHGADDLGADYGSESIETETTRVLDRDGYAVELLAFESLPEFYLTANCYVPDGEGPHPGILFLCGHVDAGKADPKNQKAAIELARNGFVVLVVDPVAQGERRQYRDAETGEGLVGKGGGTFAHCYAGQQCFYAGASLARYFVHDARRGLDYLAGRRDVDDDRLGVTGTSGGGIQTQYLALVDDRIDAAAPCCSVTTREEWLKTGKRIDGEQLVYGAISRGIDHDDFLAAMAPRPVFVGSAASDQYFPVEGASEAVERVRRAYDLYDDPESDGRDAEENVEWVVADEGHCSVYEVGDPVFEWLCEQLGDSTFESHDEDNLAVVDEADLHVTPEGSVREYVPGERTIADLTREFVADNCSESRVESAPTDSEASAGNLRQTVTEQFDLDRDGCDLHPRFVAETEDEGLRVEYVWFRTERDPDAVVTGVLVTDPEASARSAAAPAESPAVVCFEEGTEELPERSDEVASLAAEYGTVLTFDPRGVGAVRNREIPIPNWVEEYFGIYGTEFKLGYDALLLESSLFGMRVFDVLRAAEFLREETGAEAVSLVGEGVGAYHALYAAVADERVETTELRDLGPSFREMATSREYPYDARLTVFDVVGDCDVPHCLAALDDRNVGVERASR